MEGEPEHTIFKNKCAQQADFQEIMEHCVRCGSPMVCRDSNKLLFVDDVGGLSQCRYTGICVSGGGVPIFTIDGVISE